jgi:hypothetical protein
MRAKSSGPEVEWTGRVPQAHRGRPSDTISIFRLGNPRRPARGGPQVAFGDKRGGGLAARAITEASAHEVQLYLGDACCDIDPGLLLNR